MVLVTHRSNGHMPLPSPLQALQSLVEYDDEDSDEEEMSQETASPAKKQRLEVSLET